MLAVELDAERQRSSGTSRAAARAEEHMRTSAASAALLRDQLKQVHGSSSQEFLSYITGRKTCNAGLEEGASEIAAVHDILIPCETAAIILKFL